MIIVKNGYTLAEGAQREYTYRYQAVPYPAQRSISAPAHIIEEDGEGNFTMAYLSLQGDPIGFTGSYNEFLIESTEGTEINITAIDSSGNGNYYFSWWTAFTAPNNRMHYYRSLRIGDGETTTTEINSIGYYPDYPRTIYFELRTNSTDTRINNIDNAIYPTARMSVGLLYKDFWDGIIYSLDTDRYLIDNNLQVLLSSQNLSRTDYLYTVTGGVVT